jgi:hypothetical protein
MCMSCKYALHIVIGSCIYTMSAKRRLGDFSLAASTLTAVARWSDMFFSIQLSE